MSKLQTHDRNLLTDLAQAGFSNPFGEIRDTLNQRIGANLGVDHFDVDMQAFVGPLNQRLRNLASLGFDRLDKMPFSSRFEFEMAILFTLFHTFLHELDQHIENQTNNGTARTNSR